ncbi:Uncharacterised protein [uncultured Bacteroides sp.]|nr:Uncharacterised protein [uncultured Bacteroides sp.]
MIAVVIGFQFRTRLLVTHPRSRSQCVNILFKVGVHFLLADAADFHIAVVHGNVHQVVQIAEHADLSELGHSRQQGEADAAVHGLQRPVERLQGAAVLVLQGFVADGLQHGLVVFIDENHHPAACLLACTANHSLKTGRYGILVRVITIFSLPLFQGQFQLVFQTCFRIILFCVQIHVQHRIHRPVPLQFFQRQSFEKFFLPLRVGFESRQQQTLAETSRTTQEIVTSCVKQLINQGSFIDIFITAQNHFLKVLHSYRI